VKQGCELCDSNNTTMNNSEPSTKYSIPKGLRRLKWNELVSVGDFVADEQRGMEPWEGPNGFRADAFVKPIYRRAHGRLTGT
jgi:hypothetical protein